MAKGKSVDKDGSKDGGAKKSKGAQSINVRHILCEKHGKKELALAKLNDGSKFDDVAREFSEDKARQGAWGRSVLFPSRELTWDRGLAGLEEQGLADGRV